MTDPGGAEAWLSGLDKLGWRFGLGRIRRLCDVLGMPQRRFASIHVVGSNGKSSVARLVAALLEAQRLRTGTYLSPHLERWSERVHLGGREIAPADFERAVSRTREAVAIAERSFEEGERVTQFEAATAAAFQAFAEARVQVGIVEAGLGGRLDATNVIPSRITVLTSVSLEHTDLLGETEEKIAAEKLAVLTDHSTLVVGRVSEGVMSLAERIAGERGAVLVPVTDEGLEVPEGIVGAYPRRNFAVAMRAAEAFTGRAPDPDSVNRIAASIRLPARLEVREGDPPLILDAAHNPEGIGAVVESLPELTGGRPPVALLAALADKPIGEIASPLARACASVVCTEIPEARLEGVGRPGARAHPAAELAAACVAAGGRAEAVPDPTLALERARGLAADEMRTVLVTGSFYLLAALLLGEAH
jgi:dihydrofolate synthase/folylpolyglutamate synthase